MYQVDHCFRIPDTPTVGQSEPLTADQRRALRTKIVGGEIPLSKTVWSSSGNMISRNDEGNGIKTDLKKNQKKMDL